MILFKLVIVVYVTNEGGVIRETVPSPQTSDQLTPLESSSSSFGTDIVSLKVISVGISQEAGGAVKGFQTLRLH